MRKGILIAFALIFSMIITEPAKAQTQTVADSTLQALWSSTPSARPILKELFPGLFKTISFEQNLWDGWKVYSANNQTEWYISLKIGGNWVAICELGSAGGNYAKGWIGADSVLVVSPNIGNSEAVPKHIQDLIDRINP